MPDGVEKSFPGDLVESGRDALAKTGDVVERGLDLNRRGGLETVGERAQCLREAHAVQRRRPQFPDHPASILHALPQHRDGLVELPHVGGSDGITEGIQPVHGSHDRLHDVVVHDASQRLALLLTDLGEPVQQRFNLRLALLQAAEELGIVDGDGGLLADGLQLGDLVRGVTSPAPHRVHQE